MPRSWSSRRLCSASFSPEHGSRGGGPDAWTISTSAVTLRSAVIANASERRGPRRLRFSTYPPIGPDALPTRAGFSTARPPYIRMTGSSTEGEDVMQEALFDAYRKLPAQFGTDPTRAWRRPNDRLWRARVSRFSGNPFEATGLVGTPPSDFLNNAEPASLEFSDLRQKNGGRRTRATTLELARRCRFGSSGRRWYRPRAVLGGEGSYCRRQT
jgi:hypothetical protein